MLLESADVILEEATIPAIAANRPQSVYARNISSLELSHAIRLALEFIPTDWIYIPRAVFLSISEMITIQMAVIIMGVGIGPAKDPKKAKDGFLT